MKRLAIAFLFIQTLALAQQPVPLRSRVYNGITSSATVLDNRSTLYQETLHTFCASGSGSWEVQVQYADGSPSGFVSFTGALAIVNNSSDNCVGLGMGYHDFIRFSVTGTATVNYAGTAYIYFPIGGSGGGGTINSVLGTSNQISASTAFGVATLSLPSSLIIPGKITLHLSSTGSSSLNLPNGTAPTSPVTGDIWAASGVLKYYNGSSTVTLLTTGDSIPTTQLTGTLQGAQFPALTGDVTTSSGSLATTLATVNSGAGLCGDATHICQVTTNAKGLVTTQAQISVTSGFVNPMTTLGDTMYGAVSGTATRLAGNTAAVKNFFCQTGTGSVSAAPVWCALVIGDLPAISSSVLTDASTLVKNNQANTFSGGGLQDLSVMKIKPPLSVIASFPSAAANANAVYIATDAVDPTDCATGLGTSRAWCISTGSVWQSLASSAAVGANQALSNLSSVAINTSLLTQAAGIDLGSTAKPFRDLYIYGSGTFASTYLKLTGTPTSTRTITFPDVTGTVTVLGNTSTGSGSVVLATGATLVTPTLGVASATSLNKITVTAPATGATFTLTDGKTLAVSNTMTLVSSDGATLTFQGTDTYVGRNTVDSLQNKTLITPTISSFTNATHTHANAAGGGQLTTTAFASGNKTGTGTKLATAPAAGTSGNCAQWDVNGDVGDAGAACGTSAPNFSQSFTAQTSVVLTHNAGTTAVVPACYDNATPPNYLEFNTLALTSSNSVTVTFTSAQTGFCVVNSTGGVGSNPLFASVISGTNTSAAMVLGSGSSVDFSGSGTNTASQTRIAISTKTSNFSFATTDGFILCNAVGGVITGTLPSAASYTGREFKMKKIDASANSCTFSSSDNIDGAATLANTTQYQSFSVISNGTSWWAF